MAPPPLSRRQQRRQHRYSYRGHANLALFRHEMVGDVWRRFAATTGCAFEIASNAFPSLRGNVNGNDCHVSIAWDDDDDAFRTVVVTSARSLRNIRVTLRSRSSAWLPWWIRRALPDESISDDPRLHAFFAVQTDAPKDARVLFVQELRRGLIDFPARSTSRFAYDAGRITFSWRGTEKRTDVLHAALELCALAASLPHDNAAAPYR